MGHDQGWSNEGQAALSFLLLREALGRVRVEFSLQLVVRVDQAPDEAIVELLELD